MIKIVTIGALKGGVGKTNFCFNLACFLALIKNKKILVIDLDPQANLTNCFKITSDLSLVKKMCYMKFHQIKIFILKLLRS